MKRNTLFALLVGITMLGAIAGPMLLPHPVVADGVNFNITNLNDTLPHNDNPQQIVINIIKAALGVLSLVAVSFIIYGGFRWITAAGNEESITTAKSVISAAVIGLIIVLLSYAIVLLVGNLTQNAANGTLR